MSRWCQSPATVGWVLHGEAERRDGAPVRGRVAAAGGGRGALVAGPTGGPGGPLVGARAVDGEGAPARPRRRPGRAAAGRGAGGRAGRRARRRLRAGPGDPPARGAVARRTGRRARGAGRGGVRGDRRAGAGHPPAAVPGRCRARQGQGAEAARRPAGVGVVDGPLGGAGRRPVRSRGRPLRGPRRDPAGRLIHRGLTSSPRNPVLRGATLEPPGPPVLRGATLEPPGPPVLPGATPEPPGPPGRLPAARLPVDHRPEESAREGAVHARYDMVVIGAGPAGEKGAAQAAYFGKRAAVVEHAPRPGGAAVSTAGVPTKTLRETALYITGFRRRDVYGVSLHLDPEATLEHLRSRAADVVLIASGSHPFHPPGIPFDDPDVYDSEQILTVDRPFRSLAVVGRGIVGCEYASIFTALGVEVTMVGGGSLAPMLDAELSRLLAEAFERAGMQLHLDKGRPAVARDERGLAVTLPGGGVLRPEKVLMATGRAGNTEGLGLEAAGVAVDGRGQVVVDATMRTTAPGVYAAGDVVGPPVLASVSMEQGRVAACYAFGIPFKDTVDPIAPYGVYTIPEAAMAGLTEEAAAEQGIDYEVGRGWFRANARATISGADDGLVKLVFARADRRLLGVHILGDMAAELVHLGQAALHFGATIDYFIHTTFNIPTQSEAYKYAAYDGLQRLQGRVAGDPGGSRPAPR